MGITPIATCNIFASSPEVLRVKKERLLALFAACEELPKDPDSPRFRFIDQSIKLQGGPLSPSFGFIKCSHNRCFAVGHMVDVNRLYSGDEKIACLQIFRQALELGLCQSLHVLVRRKGRLFGIPFTDLTLVASIDFAMLDLLKFYSHLDEARMDDIGEVVTTLSETSPKLEFPMAGWKALEKQALADPRFAICIKRSNGG
jgi:hypothetical protein